MAFKLPIRMPPSAIMNININALRGSLETPYPLANNFGTILSFAMA